MPLYIVTTTATTEVRERWAVQAASFDEAQEKVSDGDAAFMGEEVLPNERDREYHGAELAGTREADVRAVLETAGYDVEDEA